MDMRGVHRQSVRQPPRGGVKSSPTRSDPLPFTQVSCRVVPAVPALPGAGVTGVGVAVTLAGAAAGEAPLAWLAVRALPPGGSRPALALA